jgi:hypothetical protein
VRWEGKRMNDGGEPSGLGYRERVL